MRERLAEYTPEYCESISEVPAETIRRIAKEFAENACIGQTMMGRHAEVIEKSPYKSWFDACTCREYLESNQRWIDLVDDRARGIGVEETEILCRIFEHCAVCENHFWDMLYEKEMPNH